VWSGDTIAEERDATGANVTKRYFAEGEQRVGGADAGNYFYTRDHLGSIREITDVNGNLVAQMTYDVWGNESVLAGNMNFDFGSMSKQRKTALVIASLILAYGIIAIWVKKVAWIDGVHEASGGQAQLIGAFCIAFSIFIFASCFRPRGRP
jgi:hypothetical protein